ncbi:hypothetical protein ACFQ14_12340 [Pseudahrensia aquimaris]|uniref:UrcA family protein n=1 Tax=Pseudahrensia aquimaris TaxID=744461 RepID=A0ABW3FGC3_9HYPH
MSIFENQTRLVRNSRYSMAAIAVAAIVGFSATPALAANITDADGCNTAVAASEKAIVRATLSAEDLNMLVSLADQAKSACTEADFAKASKITTAIEDKLKSVATQ